VNLSTPEKPMIFVPRARFWYLSTALFFIVLSALTWFSLGNLVFPSLFYVGISVMFLFWSFPTLQTIKISNQHLSYLFFDASREINFELCNKIFFIDPYLKPRNLVLGFKDNGFKVVPKELESVSIPIMYFHQHQKILRLIVENTKNLNPNVEIDPRILQKI
jgi:hypothetical protein